MRGKNSETSNEVDLKRKLKIDPLSLMNSYTENKSKVQKTSNHTSASTKPNRTLPATETKHTTKKTTEQLRAERVKRENNERQRVNELLNPSCIKPKATVELDDRKRSYNSQYNPNLSRY